MSRTVIKVENLSKQYRLGQISRGALYQDMNRWWHRMRGKEDPYLQLSETNVRSTASTTGFVWSLKDLNFEVNEGDAVGIIGKNGAGKSTLLKILSRVTTPTTGDIKVKGRIASLLEVGTGFHPELTGKENIFLNAAILGMTKQEVRKKYDEIVAFSGVERYIDTPVKRYSSGMYVRLAFAVAAYLESEILIVDEVLAVGDIEFQKKCLGKMQEVGQKEGRTVLFVSHNMGALRGLCKKAILLEDGKLKKQGEVNDVIAEYLVNPSAVFTKALENSNDTVVIESVAFSNAAGENTQNFRYGDDLVVTVRFRALSKYVQPHFWIGVQSQHGALFGANMLIDGKKPESIEGEGSISCRFRSLPLLPQTYSVRLGVRDRNGRDILTQSKDVGFFNIIGNVTAAEEAESDYAEIFSTNSSPVLINYEWKMPDGKLVPVNFVK